MAWLEQWSIKVDTHELNDKSTYFTNIPEIDDIGTSYDVVVVDLANEWPVFIQ